MTASDNKGVKKLIEVHFDDLAPQPSRRIDGDECQLRFNLRFKKIGKVIPIILKNVSADGLLAGGAQLASRGFYNDVPGSGIIVSVQLIHGDKKYVEIKIKHVDVPLVSINHSNITTQTITSIHDYLLKYEKLHEGVVKSITPYGSPSIFPWIEHALKDLPDSNLVIYTSFPPLISIVSLSEYFTALKQIYNVYMEHFSLDIEDPKKHPVFSRYIHALNSIEKIMEEPDL